MITTELIERIMNNPVRYSNIYERWTIEEMIIGLDLNYRLMDLDDLTISLDTYLSVSYETPNGEFLVLDYTGYRYNPNMSDADSYLREYLESFIYDEIDYHFKECKHLRYYFDDDKYIDDIIHNDGYSMVFNYNGIYNVYTIKIEDKTHHYMVGRIE